MKQCKCCKQYLPLIAFSADSKYPYCRPCVKIKNKKYRTNNKEKLKLYEDGRYLKRAVDPEYLRKSKLQQRKWVENNRDKHTARKLRWRDANRLKTKAHTAVKDALRRGKLIRLPCIQCQSTINLEAHHEDYTKPLDIIWMCRPCHVKFHTKREQI